MALILRYVCNKISTNFFSEKQNLINNEDFGMIKDDFRLIYFSSFVDEESSVFNNICEKIYHFDKKYKLNIFTFYSRISNKNDKRWDLKFINEKLKYEENIKKAYICGPVGFLNHIKKLLLDTTKLRVETIHLV